MKDAEKMFSLIILLWAKVVNIMAYIFPLYFCAIFYIPNTVNLITLLIAHRSFCFSSVSSLFLQARMLLHKNSHKQLDAYYGNFYMHQFSPVSE